MGILSEKKQNVAGTIASLQTILERYPVLITTDEKLGKTSITFMLNLLKMFGVTENDIIEWMGNLLADKKDGADGLLTVIEAAIKTIILASFKETYTCAVDPLLPDDIMLDIYEYTPRGDGIEIKIEDIDYLGLLSYCPTDKNGIGGYFYFDNNDYTPMSIYSSTDFNAYLWYVINKGSFWNQNEKERRKCMWDNRVYYRKKFEKEGCLNGKMEGSKQKFFETNCKDSPIRMVPDVGPKQEILCCEFKESQLKGNILKVWLNADRYFDINGNKTIFQFNTDYIMSLKLFDTKTLLSQVINALLGVTASAGKIGVSIETNILSKQVRQIVRNVITKEDTQEINDCYYSFSNEEYDAMIEEALLNYNGEYQSKNEANDNVAYDSEKIFDELYKIETADNLNEETTTITNVIKYVAEQLSSPNEIEPNCKFSFEFGIISDFIEEVMTQLILQILTPKVMLLFAINEKIMNREGDELSGIISFFKNFKNLVIAMIKKIKDLIERALLDFLIGQIKPLLVILVDKLLLETIYYYKILIQALMESCKPSLNLIKNNRSPLTIDNVVGADIIPSQEAPVSEEECRK